MRRHMVTCGKNQMGTGQWSGYPLSLAQTWNMAYLAQRKCYQLMRSRLTCHTHQVTWTCPFNGKTKSGFCVCVPSCSK